ncbi:Uncharacterised protein [Burkholderia pseudomallei]|nr:Uncharacterised protein [Burkholderia pseudomallei]CAJ2867885.1 Uncharacterised protein [Burkholderia pseudomallei]CAJ3020818.1 Uncharacterised protein [Burkholderia pseudomallei]CAJ3061754.1 Uncharacterised protein [Burkholderia pseudomallei]CAJ3109221.1 Uncharacterised protein [Burkholderia pseudomallei]
MPLLSAIVETVWPLPSDTYTVAPASAVPVNVGFVTLVMSSWFVPTVPAPKLSDDAGRPIVGVLIFVSITTLVGAENGLVRSPFCAWNTMSCVPSASGVLGVIAKFPIPSEVAVPSEIKWPSDATSYAVTTALAGPLPSSCGFVTFCNTPAPGSLSPGDMTKFGAVTAAGAGS